MNLIGNRLADRFIENEIGFLFSYTVIKILSRGVSQTNLLSVAITEWLLSPVNRFLSAFFDLITKKKLKRLTI